MRRVRILAPLCIALLVAACGDGRSRTLPGSSNSNNNRAACGNGAVEQGEVCDGIALGGLTCVTLGFGAGGLACTSDCRDFDRSGCGAPPTCGNGTTDGGELCDGASFGTRSCQTYGYSEGSLSCSANCGVIDTSGCSGQLAQCGNNTREGNEVCDGTDVGRDLSGPRARHRHHLVQRRLREPEHVWLQLLHPGVRGARLRA